MSNSTPMMTQKVSLKQLDVLVVDDNRDNRQIASWLLEHLGHTVSEAENGRRAVEMINTRKFDLVLMDIQMPVMDGLEAARIANGAEGAKPAIIACTSLDLPEVRQQASAVGMSGYITKPLTLKILRSLLTSVSLDRDSAIA